MLNFPNAKINLGLSVVGKMSNGYHAIETVFAPIQLKDVLEVIPSDRFEFKSWGLSIPGAAADNLIVKALDLLRTDFDFPICKIHLLKNIPFGAGLGGGSSDAAFLLKLVNAQFNLGLTNLQLMEYCNHLGSDCAFFIENKPIYAFGRGNEFRTLPIDLSGLKIVLIKPHFHISTTEAFANVKISVPEKSVLEIVQQPMSEWKDLLGNDFEASLFPKYPILQEYKNWLYEQGAIYAAMSGSGSSIFGIFSEYPKLEIAPFVAAQIFNC